MRESILLFLMRKALQQMIGMSVTAGVVILAVLLLRIFLRRAPRIFSYALWSVVLFRMLCPVSVPSPLSIMNVVDAGRNIVNQMTDLDRHAEDEMTDPKRHAEDPVTDAAQYPRQIIDTSQAIGSESQLGQNVNFSDPSSGAGKGVSESGSRSRAARTEAALAAVWLFGIGVMAAYSLISLIRLHRKTACALRLRDNIYIVDDLATPFVLGWTQPNIYLPSFLEDEEREFIILHEEHHIQRGDQMIKILSFAALCLHWFNPLAWIAFVQAGRDMEMSCDEAVMRKSGRDIRAEYSASLLNLATGRNLPAGYPLAFGAGDPQARIRNVMQYQKPSIKVILAASIVCVLTGCCLITDPQRAIAQKDPGWKKTADHILMEGRPEDGKEEDSEKAEASAIPESENGYPEEAISFPSPEEVLKVRESALEGMSEEQIARLTENIKLVNLRMEHLYLWDDLFTKLADPDSLYWNYFDSRGEIQIAWKYAGDYREMKELLADQEMTLEEFHEKYGTPVTTYNRYDAESMIALFADLKKDVRNEKLRADLQTIMDEMELAWKNHDVEHACNVYKMLHDMDYFLLRYGPEDVGKYTRDDTLVRTLKSTGK